MLSCKKNNICKLNLIIPHLVNFINHKWSDGINKISSYFMKDYQADTRETQVPNISS